MNDRPKNDRPENPGDQYEGRAIQPPARARGVPGTGGLALELPAEVVEAIAERAAELVLAQLSTVNGAGEWPAWMSVRTAASYLDVTEERVRKLVAAREIPFTQEAPGCRVFFKRSDLDAWMTSMQRPKRR